MAFRLLVRDATFTAAVVATLALGIGVATAAYSIVDAVLLEPLPFPQPERIVAVRVRGAIRGEYGVSGGVISAVDDLPAIDHVAAVMGAEENLVHGPDLSVVRGALVTSAFFDVFRAPPLVGRPLSTTGDASQEVVLSEQLWRRRFGADPSIVGRDVRLNDRRYVVAGVMSGALTFPEGAEYWRELRISSTSRAELGTGPYDTVARLGAVDLDDARATSVALSRALGLRREDGPLTISLTPLLTALTAEYERVLLSAMAAVALVLVIACANAAQLLLARTTRRVQELAVREAMGATRGRLVRQLVSESAVLAAVSAVAGCAVAWTLIRAVPAIGPADLPRLGDVALDARVAMFAVLVSAASVIVFGLAPAWALTRGVGPLGGVRSTASARTRRIGTILVAIEVGVTLTLVLGGTAATLTLYRTLSTDPGFEATGLSISTVRPSVEQYAGGERIRYFDRVVTGLRGRSGITAVAGVSHVPLSPILAERAAVAADNGRTIAPGARGARARTLAPGSLAALGVRLVKGRDFSSDDRDGASPVAIVNEALAARLWPDADPLGQMIHAPTLTSSPGAKLVVIGVVRDFRGSLVLAPLPEIYASALQRPLSSLHLLVRTSLDAKTFDTTLRSVIESVDPRQPVTESMPMAALVWQVTAYSRFRAFLLSAFAGAALALAAAGIAAVVFYAVASRTRELGIRAAVGASPRQLVTAVLTGLFVPLTLGLVGGLILSSGLSRIARHLIFLEGFDVSMAAAATAGISILAAIAAWYPARRAGLVDPVRALQHE